MNKAQILSLDLMIGVLIFVSMVILFFGVIMFTRMGGDVSELNREGEHIIKTLESDEPELSFIEQNEIKEEELKELLSRSYDSIKSEMGIRNEFCIFLEDEEGNVIPIRIEEGVFYGFGSERVNVSGMVCREK